MKGKYDSFLCSIFGIMQLAFRYFNVLVLHSSFFIILTFSIYHSVKPLTRLTARSYKSIPKLALSASGLIT